MMQMQEVAEAAVRTLQQKSERGWGAVHPERTTHHHQATDAGKSNNLFRALRSLVASLFLVGTVRYRVRGVGGAEVG